MRRSVITIEWEGRDKPVREFIEQRIDSLFEDLTYTGLVTWAQSGVEWTSRVKREHSAARRPS